MKKTWDHLVSSASRFPVSDTRPGHLLGVRCVISGSSGHSRWQFWLPDCNHRFCEWYVSIKVFLLLGDARYSCNLSAWEIGILQCYYRRLLVSQMCCQTENIKSEYRVRFYYLWCLCTSKYTNHTGYFVSMKVLEKDGIRFRGNQNATTLL